jgi:uncharacterized protein YbaP (TraB family)
MNRLIRHLCLAFAALCVTAAVQAAPPEPLLWKAKTRDGQLYLLGSFHLLKKRDYPLDPRVETAYAASRSVVFEIDPDEMASPGTLAQVQALARFSDGRTLSSVLPAETAEKLQKFLGGEAAMAGADHFKPWFMSVNLSVGMMSMTGLDPKLGLDQHFMQRARKDGKKILGLETTIEQIGALDNAPMSEQVAMLSDALAPASEVKRKINELHDAWRSGDAARLTTMVNGEMAKSTPHSYRLLGRDRNLRWLPELRSLLDDGGTHLVVVGTMHLLGEDGLVELLRERGVKVERVESAELLPLDEAA